MDVWQIFTDTGMSVSVWRYKVHILCRLPCTCDLACIVYLHSRLAFKIWWSRNIEIKLFSEKTVSDIPREPGEKHLCKWLTVEEDMSTLEAVVQVEKGLSCCVYNDSSMLPWTAYIEATARSVKLVCPLATALGEYRDWLRKLREWTDLYVVICLCFHKVTVCILLVKVQRIATRVAYGRRQLPTLLKSQISCRLRA